MKTALDEPLGFFVLFCFVFLRNLVQTVGIVRVAALYSPEKHHSLLHHPCEECSLGCTTYFSLLLYEGLLTLSHRDTCSYGFLRDNCIKTVSRAMRTYHSGDYSLSYLSCGFLLVMWGSRSIFPVCW